MDSVDRFHHDNQPESQWKSLNKYKFPPSDRFQHKYHPVEECENLRNLTVESDDKFYQDGQPEEGWRDFKKGFSKISNRWLVSSTLLRKSEWSSSQNIGEA